MSTPAVQRLSDAVILQGPALHDIAYLVGLGIRYRAQVDGCPPREVHRHLLAMLTDAAVSVTESGIGHGEVREEGNPEESPLGDVGPLATDTAARMLGLTERQVRRIASHIGGRRVGRAWMFDRAAVSAEAARRREESNVHTE